MTVFDTVETKEISVGNIKGGLVNGSLRYTQVDDTLVLNGKLVIPNLDGNGVSGSGQIALSGAKLMFWTGSTWETVTSA